MEKVAAATSVTLLQAVNTAAHMTHQEEPTTSQGIHATGLETAILVILTALALGMIGYGVKHATDDVTTPEESDKDVNVGVSHEENGDDE